MRRSLMTAQWDNVHQSYLLENIHCLAWLANYAQKHTIAGEMNEKTSIQVTQVATFYLLGKLLIVKFVLPFVYEK